MISAPPAWLRQCWNQHVTSYESAKSLNFRFERWASSCPGRILYQSYGIYLLRGLESFAFTVFKAGAQCWYDADCVCPEAHHSFAAAECSFRTMPSEPLSETVHCKLLSNCCTNFWIFHCRPVTAPSLNSNWQWPEGQRLSSSSNDQSSILGPPDDSRHILRWDSYGLGSEWALSPRLRTKTHCLSQQGLSKCSDESSTSPV